MFLFSTATFDVSYFGNYGKTTIGTKVVYTQKHCGYSTVFNIIKGVTEQVGYFSLFFGVQSILLFQFYRKAALKIMSATTPATVMGLLVNIYHLKAGLPIPDEAHKMFYRLVYEE